MVPELVGDAPSMILSAKDDVISGPSTLQKEQTRIQNYGKSNCEMHILNGAHCTMLRDDKETYETLISSFMNKL